MSWTLARYRAKFNDQLNLMTPIWRRGGDRQGVYLACVGAKTTRGGVIRGCVVFKSVYMTADIFCIRIITNDYSSSVKDNIHDACFLPITRDFVQ